MHSSPWSDARQTSLIAVPVNKRWGGGGVEEGGKGVTCLRRHRGSFAYVMSLSHNGACNDRAVDDNSVMIINIHALCMLPQVLLSLQPRSMNRDSRL